MIGAIFWGIIGGAVIGVLGRLVLPGRQNVSMLATVVAGILAATLGGIIATWLGVGETRGIDWIKHIFQIALAALFVYVVERMQAHRHVTSTPAGPSGMPRT
jgi:uncharacterized membrane protein YeaQ/YmgE (transglycosylase-associated protein family)